MKCPTCSKEGIPRCPVYDKCKFRIAGLASHGLCWRKPHFCNQFKKIKKKASWNPSMREET